MNRIVIPGFTTVTICLGLCALSFAQTERNQTADSKISIASNDGSIDVSVNNQPFTSYVFNKYDKPVFYPIYGPKQISMTRNFPMRNVSGESKDHPHHKSMWIGHQLGGVDFWGEQGGAIKLSSVKVGDQKLSFKATHDWINNQTNEIVVSDQINVSFGAGTDFRFIDYEITFLAELRPVIFDDTKEGFFALRVHPQLRHSGGLPSATKSSGKMVNDQGTSGKNIWGQRGRWVNYYGNIDGSQCGISVFDHPTNLRHPTTWHARDYGLLAANPFGLHYFQQQPKGAGRFVLEQGGNLKFRYRVIFHAGHWQASKMNQHFSNFAKSVRSAFDN